MSCVYHTTENTSHLLEGTVTGPTLTPTRRTVVGCTLLCTAAVSHKTSHHHHNRPPKYYPRHKASISSSALSLPLLPRKQAHWASMGLFYMVPKCIITSLPGTFLVCCHAQSPDWLPAFLGRDACHTARRGPSEATGHCKRQGVRWESRV